MAESRLRKKEVAEAVVEDEIPFWEFLDIEFDDRKKTFLFKAHYTQKPTFPLLFRALQGQPTLKKIEDSLMKGTKHRINKTKWFKRSELEFQIGARNVIYYLYDSKQKLFYVGEARDLVKRLKQPYLAMPNRDYFRYDVLPDSLEPYRLAIERMVIFAFSKALKTSKGKDDVLLSKRHLLTNDRIDRS